MKTVIILILSVTICFSCKSQIHPEHAGNLKYADTNIIQDKDFKNFVLKFTRRLLPFNPEEDEKTEFRFDIQQRISREEALKYLFNNDTSLLIDRSNIKKGLSSIYQFPTNGKYILLYYLEATEAGGPFVLAAFTCSGKMLWKLNIYGDFTKFMVKNDEIAYEKWFGTINNELLITIKYFQRYDSKNTGICYGYYNEYIYKINPDGTLQLIDKKESGKKKFNYNKALPDSSFIKWQLIE